MVLILILRKLRKTLPDWGIGQLVVVVGCQLLALGDGHHGHDALDVAEPRVEEVLELAIRGEGVTDLQVNGIL